MATPKKIKLTYFDIEGAAEPIRLALVLAGVEFEDDRIKSPEWKELKPKTPYGGLPIMTIDDQQPPQAQSMAILRHVGATMSTDLYPPEKLLAIEEAIAVVDDMKTAWGPCLYMGMRPENFGRPAGFSKTPEGTALIQEMRLNFVKDRMPTHMKHLGSLLAKHENTFLAGNKPTIADCVAVAFLRSFTKGHIDHVPTSCLEPYPEIIAYVKRFCALEAIKGRYTDGLHE